MKTIRLLLVLAAAGGLIPTAVAAQQTPVKISCRSILPDSIPLALRYRSWGEQGGVTSEPDTVDLIILESVEDIEFCYSWPLTGEGHEEPLSSRGSGWRIIDAFGQAQLWLETEIGLNQIYTGLNHDQRYPLHGRLVVPARPDTMPRWSHYYDASEAVLDTLPVNFNGELYRGVRTKMGHRTEGAVRQWAFGLGLVSEKYEAPYGQGSHYLELIEIVERDDVDRIVSLDLCSLSPDTGQLGGLLRFPQLTELYLDRSSIDDMGLAFITGLANLELLDLSDTKITGNGYPPLPSLPQLKDLRLAGTLVHDATIGFIPNLQSLHRLDLRNTLITDRSVRMLIGALRLEELLLGNNTEPVTGEPDRYSRHQGIFDGIVRVHRTFITSKAMRYLKKFKNLKVLDLSGTSVANEGLRHLLKLPDLKVLDLSGTLIGDRAMRTIRRMDGLKDLDLARTSVGDEGVKELAEMDELERLNLSGSQVTDEGVKTLSEMRNLKSLNLRETSITEETVPFLGRMKNLRLLVLPEDSRWRAELVKLLPDTKIYPFTGW